VDQILVCPEIDLESFSFVIRPGRRSSSTELPLSALNFTSLCYSALVQDFALRLFLIPLLKNPLLSNGKKRPTISMRFPQAFLYFGLPEGQIRVDFD
jgi:hypothetical protein